jgi:hypothetical protein
MVGFRSGPSGGRHFLLLGLTPERQKRAAAAWAAACGDAYEAAGAASQAFGQMKAAKRINKINGLVDKVL